MCFQIAFFSQELLVLSGTLLFPGMGQGWMCPCVCSAQHLDTFDSVPPLMSPPSSGENQHRAPCILCGFWVRKSCHFSCSAPFLVCFSQSEAQWGSFAVVLYCLIAPAVVSQTKIQRLQSCGSKSNLDWKCQLFSVFPTTQVSSLVLKPSDSEG